MNSKILLFRTLFLTTFFIYFLGLSKVHALESYYPLTRTLLEKGYEIGSSFDYYESDSFRDDQGQRYSFLDGESFRRYQTSFFGGYGLLDSLSFWMKFNVRRNESHYFDDSGSNELIAKNVTSPESLSARIVYSFDPILRLFYSLESSFSVRAFTNEVDGELVVGDDGPRYSVGGAMTYASRSGNFFTTRVLYQKPGDHLSSEIILDNEFSWVWKKFSLTLGAHGVYSLQQDPYEYDPYARPSYNTGVSYLYHSKNREFVSPYIGLNFLLGEAWRVETKAQKTFALRSYDEGQAFSLSFVKRVEKKSQKNKKYKKIKSQFKEYNLEAEVIKVSSDKRFVQINKGASSNIREGIIVDFFDSDLDEHHHLIARGMIIKVQTFNCIVKITDYFQLKKTMNETVIARLKN